MLNVVLDPYFSQGLDSADSVGVPSRSVASTSTTSCSKLFSVQEQREEVTPFDYDDEEPEAYVEGVCI